MPPKCKFTRAEIVCAALEITREQGVDSVTARAVGARLQSSSKVIFSLFQNMEELQNELIKAADALYQSYLAQDMSGGKYPPYKASGMAYIRFAKEEKELFKLLFMRDRSRENVQDNTDSIKPIIEIIMKTTGLSEEEALLFHLEMWVFVHGIATMIATSYLEWDMEFVSKVLSDNYWGLKRRHCERNDEHAGN